MVAPSLLCQTPLARNVISSQLGHYGFSGGVQQIGIGWFSPLRIQGIELVGNTAGSRVTVESVDTDITILKALSGLSDLGEITVRGVVAELSVASGTSSIEQDLALLMQADPEEPKSEDDGSQSSMQGRLQIREVAVKIQDTDHKLTWVADKSNATSIYYRASTMLAFHRC